ncbi:MAG: DUF7710 domain-containing protein [Myxococcota bacterium]
MTESTDTEHVWIFNGAGARFPCAAFRTREQAEEQIRRHQMSGMLTKYPLGTTVYDWAVESGAFEPSRDEQESPEYIQRFSSAHLEHYHYEDGES